MKAIPTGKDDFKKIIDGNYYYVDKTMIIQDILKEEVVLYTRPRRFGKTLNMSMLNYFYNIKENENAYLFDGLEISKDKEVMQHQNKYPVISITLKEMKQSSFQEQMNDFKEIIGKALRGYKEILQSNYLDEIEKEKLYAYYKGTVNKAQLSRSLEYISECLEKHYGEKVIILIDEYDVPLQHAYLQGYYDEMVGFLRNVFSAALKTNSSLRQGILTGCLRIAKESIFTGMNNFKVNSIFSNMSSDKFGFTPNDVDQMLDYYELTSCKEEIQRWYDGYLFGKQEVFNPWSTNMYVDARLHEEVDTGISYWANTSGNDIVMRYIQQGGYQMKKEFEILVNKGSIVKKIMPELTYREMEDINNIYSFLLFTGYLKIGKQIDRNVYELEVPNEEVREVYANQFEQYFEEYKKEHKHEFMNALESEETSKVNEILNDILFRSVSYYDNKESFYHGFILGLLSDYEVLSNEEAGSGRLDIVIRPRKMAGNVIIMECKYASSEDDLIYESKKAIEQIKEKRYMEKPAYQMYGGVVAYGISFYKKQCYVLAYKKS